MASTGKCEYCGATVSSADEHCPSCGAPNPNFVAETERQIFMPKTIEELKEYCAERGMPLLRMRFFIGEDYREPKAFGIYRDGDKFIVYKNKADGQRAVRYQGPDEAYAVSELFAKLLEECHNRGIYPDGKIPEDSGVAAKRQRKSRKTSVITTLIIIFSLLITAVSFITSVIQHRDDGYYSTGNGTVYYHYGNDWYFTYDVNAAGYWYEADDFPVSDYSDYSLGENWSSDWGVSDFKNSSTWHEIQESHSSSSSDYDSWDSSSTDWDSDW